jgi:hypothetical protein
MITKLDKKAAEEFIANCDDVMPPLAVERGTATVREEFVAELERKALLSVLKDNAALIVEAAANKEWNIARFHINHAEEILKMLELL